MDEAALRAMMPMSFGKKAPARQAPNRKAAPSRSQASFNRDDADSTSQLQSSDVHKATLQNETYAVEGEASSRSALFAAPPVQDEDLDEDGLTREEREANRLAEQREKKSGRRCDDDNSDGGNESEDEDDDDELGPEPKAPDISTALPTSESVLLKDHTKAILALALDASGARIATGSLDYDVKLWDFGGMTQSFKPFKTFEPFESHAVHDLAWSGNGEHLLVATGTAQPQLYDRNGNLLYAYKKGDMYIRDMKNTAGHVAEVTSCFWHPTEANTFATTSTDSSIRLWNMENANYQKTVIVVKSKERGARTKVTCGAFSPDGKTLAAGCMDGALHIWSTSGTYSRPNASVEGAHLKDAEISSVCFTRDGRTLASRGTDGTVKLWDLRNFKKPIAERSGLPNTFRQTNVVFSPDETAILTGTSVERETDDTNGELDAIKKNGHVEVLARNDLRTLRIIELPDDPSSVIKVIWQPRINQLLVATSQGAVHLFYSPTLSTRGALLCVDKKGRNRRNADELEDEFGLSGPIITPGAIDPQQRGQGFSQLAKKRKMERMRQDPVASRMPDRPLEGRGKGGRIGAAAQQHMVQGMYTDHSRNEDPREALLKYADKAEKDRKWTSAWNETQPEPVFEQGDEHDDGRGGELRGGRPQGQKRK